MAPHLTGDISQPIRCPTAFAPSTTAALQTRVMPIRWRRRGPAWVSERLSVTWSPPAAATWRSARVSTDRPTRPRVV